MLMIRDVDGDELMSSIISRYLDPLQKLQLKVTLKFFIRNLARGLELRFLKNELFLGLKFLNGFLFSIGL